jgi:pSer/pThr/pTyr-binding forkhead associated (FHA) protein
MSSSIKLVIHSAQGQPEEFLLDKNKITLGRGVLNDITLSDAKASRQHAQLELLPEPLLTDLNSSNGTWIEGVRVGQYNLKPGQRFNIGAHSLHYEIVNTTAEPPDVTIIDSENDLERTIAEARQPIILNDTHLPRLAIHLPNQTSELPLTNENTTLGRHTSNDIDLEFDQASRYHARIERQGDDFILRDLGSTNGTWMGEQRINTHILRDGDVFRIGLAKLTFKKPFNNDELTMVETNDKKHSLPPIVFVPGFFGSELHRGQEKIWPNITRLLREPELFNSNVPMEAKRIVGEVVIVPNLITQEKYDRMGDFLEEALGYERGKNLLEVPYDWRQDNRLSAKTLANAIDDWQARVPSANRPLVLIAHSMGTLVARYYVEKLGGKKKVDRLIVVGGPHFGTPKILFGLLTGRGVLPFGLMGDTLRTLLSSMPSAYQLLPTLPCVEDQDGRKIDVLNDETWLPLSQRGLLRDARSFRQELGTSVSVPATSIFGYGLKTHMKLGVKRDNDGSWLDIKFDLDAHGDDTIPEWSAVLDNSDVHPVKQRHGALYVDNDVKMRLKIELSRYTK